MKPVVKVAERFVTSLLLPVSLMLAGCSDHIRGYVKQELRRPTGGLTAILAQTAGGATVSDGYYVYLKRDEDGLVQQMLFLDDTDAAPVMHWESLDKLIIFSPCGTVLSFRNSMDFKLPTGEYESIFVSLKNEGLCKHFSGAH